MTLTDSGDDRAAAAGDGVNGGGPMSGSTSVSSQNFSLASSSSSSVTACGPSGGLSASSYNPSPMMERSADVGALSTSSSPVPSLADGRYPRRRRAPDMQLGRCPWIRVYDNVTYIVAGIILRDGEGDGASPELLLIQEAKRKCRGKWYLPAGHVEPGETIEAACCREVLEETGFECKVDGLICMETRGSGWYRMSFACTITAGRLKTKPDCESLAAGWHSVERLRRQTKRSAGGAAASGDEILLRCRDFLPIVDEALRYREWQALQPQHEAKLEPEPEPDEESEADLPSEAVIQRALRAPVLNKNEAQRGLFIEFVIVKHSTVSDRVECLVHGSVRDQLQLLQPAADAFPTVEFGFEFFFPMVVSKCYRHIFEAGHQAIDLPEAVLAMWCLPAPIESVRQGLRLRILCRHKRAVAKAPLCVPQRYYWLTLEDQRVLAALRLLPGQYRPPLFML